MNIEKLIELRSEGKTFQSIADEYDTTKSALIGSMWRHNNPEYTRAYDKDYYGKNKHKRKLHLSKTQIHIYVPGNIKMGLENLAKEKCLSLSELCFSLIVDGYNYRKGGAQ